MQNKEPLSEERIREFLKGNESIEFSGQKREEVYGWVQQVLVRQEYLGQAKKQRGAIRAYAAKMTGLSLAQITRLIRKYKADGVVAPAPYRRRRFPVKYLNQDIALLAEVDRAHGWLSGPATLRVLKREHQQYGKTEYVRLAEISVAHLYNLRGSARYRKLAAKWERTRPSATTIGERRQPDPQGCPGFLRIDTVHQGDWNGVKGVYHINAVDAVTQWQVVGCVGRISEQHLLPVLEAILHQFPFRILGFHSDNGSEYINHEVAKLLKSLLIEFTKSRASRTQDNALVEGKNGAIIRKHIGYGHIAAGHAGAVQKFYMGHLNPYLNFHRPCGFATVSLDGKGKRRRQYKREDYATPYEKWKRLPEAEKYLKPGMTFARLDAVGENERHRMRAQDDGGKAVLLRCKEESPKPPGSE